MAKAKESVYKVTLSTNKKVVLREPKISHRTLASQAIAGRAGDDQFVYVTLLSMELMRLLVHSIDGKEIPARELHDLDAHFSAKEYTQLEKVVKKIMGSDEEKDAGGRPLEPTIEIAITGDS